MSTQIANATKTRFRRCSAAKMPIADRVAGCEVHADFALVPCAGSCGHVGFHRVAMHTATGALRCDGNCPGFRVRKTCTHVDAAAIAVATLLLNIEGELTGRYTPVVAAAIVDLRTGCKQLRHAYLWLVWRSVQTPQVRATGYGYFPDGEIISYKIGLRYTDLSAFEAAACAEFLGLELRKTQQAA